MIDKFVATAEQAFADIKSGSTIMVGGFGTAGIPNELIEGLLGVLQDLDIRELTIINNNAGNGERGLAALLKTERVQNIV